jgi:hypothetical protein
MAGLFDDQITPIPDCWDLIETYGARHGIKTPSEFASEMLKEARLWQSKNKGKDVLEFITPEWKDYIKENL